MCGAWGHCPYGGPTSSPKRSWPGPDAGAASSPTFYRRNPGQPGRLPSLDQGEDGDGRLPPGCRSKELSTPILVPEVHALVIPAGIFHAAAGASCRSRCTLLALLSICPMVRLRRRCSQGSPPFSGSKTSPNTLGTFCHVAGVIELAKSAKGFTPTAGRGTWAIQDDPIAQVGEVLDGHRGQSERDHPASLPRASMFSVLCP